MTTRPAFTAALVAAAFAIFAPSAGADALFSTLELPTTNSGTNAATAEVKPQGTDLVAQAFSPVKSGTANLVSLLAQTNATNQGGFTQGDIEITLRPNVGGIPGSTVLATFRGRAFSETGASPICMERVPGGGAGALTGGTSYWAVFKPLTMTTSWLVQNSTPKTVLTQLNSQAGWSTQLNPQKTLTLKVEDNLKCGPDIVPNPVPPAGLSDMYAKPGGTSFNTIAIKNSGNQTLTLTGASFSGPNASSFSLLAGEPGTVAGTPYTFPRTIGAFPDAVSILYVACNGSGAEGTRTATLTLTSNDPDESPLSWPITCIVDATPPESMVFTTNPTGRDGWYVVRPAAFSARATDVGSGDRVIAINCTDSAGPALSWINGGIAMFSLTNDGIHDLGCQATDVARNTNPPGTFKTTIKVDATEPNSTKTGGPPANTNATSASFTWAAADATSGVNEIECRLDGAAFAACASPSTVNGLADGVHTFNARARDVAGNVETTPESWTWRVDTVPPDTTLGGGPGSPTSETTATFDVGGSDPGGSGVASRQCALDDGEFGPCAAQLQLAELAEGSHTVRARAIDAAGNVDPTPASVTWVIDRTAPTAVLTQKPPTATGELTATFAFEATDAGPAANDHFECSLDGGAFVLCTSPHTLVDLGSEREHVFEVRAVDAVGNVQAPAAQYRWTISRKPVAVDDGASTEQDKPVDVAVLANDLDPAGGALSVLTFTPASLQGGTVASTPGGLRYTPPPGFTGTDSFTYRVKNGDALESTSATVTVVVTKAAPAPVVPVVTDGALVPPGPGGAGGTGGTGGTGGVPGSASLLADRFAPDLSDVHLRRGRLTFSVNEASTATIVIRRLRWRGRGAAPSLRVELPVPAGRTNVVQLRSRLAKLPAGAYSFELTVADAAGNRSPAAKRAFRIPFTRR